MVLVVHHVRAVHTKKSDVDLLLKGRLNFRLDNRTRQDVSHRRYRSRSQTSRLDGVDACGVDIEDDRHDVLVGALDR